MKNLNSWTEMAWAVMFAGYGSLAHTLMINGTTNKKLPALAGLIFVNFIISGFAGVIGYYLAIEMNLSEGLRNVFIGMMGFGGGKALEVIELRFLKKIGARKDEGGAGNDGSGGSNV